MAIDMTPAVGRILVGRARSTEFFPWFEKAGRITRISGQRIYYKDPESGNEKFLHDFTAIVDTIDEEDTLLEFTRQGKERCRLLREELDLESEKLFAQELKPVAIRRQRTRAVTE